MNRREIQRNYNARIFGCCVDGERREEYLPSLRLRAGSRVKGGKGREKTLRACLERRCRRRHLGAEVYEGGERGRD